MALSRKSSFSLALSILLLMGITPVWGQDTEGSIRPAGMFGIGVNTGGISSGGLSVQYAFAPAFEALVNIGISASSSDAESTTRIDIAPALRFRFDNPLLHFAEAGVRISNESTTLKGGGVESKTSQSETDVYLALGFFYFINRNVGFMAAVNLVELELSGSTTGTDGTSVEDTNKATRYGFLSGRAGIDFYFGR